MKILDNIPKYNDEQLLNLFNNAMTMLEKGQQIENANMVLEALKDEWRIRAERSSEGMVNLGPPKQGLLKKIGYKVGNEGASEKKRRDLIDFIICADPLPFVWSPAYMAEWGEPMSKKRYNKLTTVIRSLAVKNQNVQNIDKAIIEWQTDLDYIDENWRDKVL